MLAKIAGLLRDKKLTIMLFTPPIIIHKITPSVDFSIGGKV